MEGYACGFPPGEQTRIKGFEGLKPDDRGDPSSACGPSAMLALVADLELASLPADIADRIAAVAEKSGFVPNMFLALAARPDEFRAFFAYHDAVMDKPSGLSKADREMIVVATSALNKCPYCVVAHGAILRIRANDPFVSDLVAANWRSAPIGARQKAMLAFAEKLCLQPDTVGPEDHATLAAAGLDGEEIWDVAAVTSLFALSNRMAHFLDVRPNAEFFTLGRESTANGSRANPGF